MKDLKCKLCKRPVQEGKRALRRDGSSLCYRCAYTEDLVQWQRTGKMLAYVDEAKGVVTTWPGMVLGTVLFHHKAHHNWARWYAKDEPHTVKGNRITYKRVHYFEELRRYIRVRLVTGEVCWGWWWKGAGDYVRLYRYQRSEPEWDSTKASGFWTKLQHGLWDYGISPSSPLAQQIMGIILRHKIEEKES